MEYLEKLRNIRNVLFKAFLINVVFVTLCWGFVMFNLTQYFLWALPEFSVAPLNIYILIGVLIMDIAGAVLFLVPTLALTWAIVCEKRQQKWWEENKYKVFAKIEEQVRREFPQKTVKSKSTKTKLKKK